MDEIKVTDSYLDNTDWRVRENSSIKWSVGGLLLHQAGAVTSSSIFIIPPSPISQAPSERDRYSSQRKHPSQKDGSGFAMLAKCLILPN